ncbi:MAG: putative 2-oxoglutarate/Fe(II)-dependent dioxygenase YbiX [Candidatus Latescibacterota bacterium]|jgi:predicted 2-oxoglutarate/Fe(II)-dependent dioxygenase YbiX
MNAPSHISQGERAQDFVLPVFDGTPTRFYAHAGGAPTVLIFAPNTNEKIHSFVASLQQQKNPPDIFIVQTTQEVTDTSITIFTDPEGKVRQAYRIGVSDQTIVLLLNPNLRVLSTHTLDDISTTVEAITQTLAEQSQPSPQELTTHAPVLLIPHVLTPDICQALINVWQNQGNEETGVEQSIHQHRENIIDHTNKKRRDHVVTDEKLMRLISTTVGRRVMPELKKAFHFEATRFEGFKIVCYDSEEKGFFHAHRDNLSPSTAHRRFALTLNLNAGYEGGHLTFPEYGPHLYKPKTGAAILFSSSHLHEVTPVTQGKRFTLLSFLFGENDIRTK